MNRNRRIIPIMIMFFVALGSIVGSLYLRNKTNETKQSINNLPRIEKQEFLQQVLPEEVESYQEKVEEAFTSFLRVSDEVDSQITTDGYKFLSSLFVVSGIAVVEKDAKKSVKEEYYNPFTYEFSNFAIRSTKKDFSGFEVFVDLTVRYEGNHIYNTLISIELDKENRIVGGVFYGQV